MAHILDLAFGLGNALLLPMNQPLRVLHLEDDQDFARLVRDMFELQGIAATFEHAVSGEQFKTAIAQKQFDIILADHWLPDCTSDDALAAARQFCPNTPVILLTGAVSESQAIESLRRGATDYVLKTGSGRLIPAVTRAIREVAVRAEKQTIWAEMGRRDRYYHALTENALGIVGVLDAEGWFRYISPSVERLLGHSPEVVKGSSAFSFIHPDDLMLVRKAFEQTAKQSGRIETLDFRARHADGSWRYLEAVAQNRLDDPEIAGIVLNASDINDRKLAEKETLETAQQYRLIFDGNPIPIWVFDQETLAFLEVNDAAVQKYGYSREEFLAMKISDLRVADEEPAMFEYLHRLVNTERVASMDLAGTWRHKSKQGAVFDVEVKWSPVSFRGRPAFLTMAIDITERRRREHRDLALSQLGQRLSSASSPAGAARIIRDAAADLLPWDGFDLRSYDELTGVISPLLVDARSASSPFASPLCADGLEIELLVRDIVENGAHLVALDAVKGAAPAWAGTFQLCGLSSAMFVPVRTGHQAIGVLCIGSRSSASYNQHDLGLLQTLADHCGGALERIHTETALRESELLFHSVWENSLDGLRLTDADGAAIAVNDAFCALTGLSRAELQGHPFTEVFRPCSETDELMRGYKAAFASRSAPKPREISLPLRSGRHAVLDERSSFVERPGRPPLILAMLRDVTAQRQLEDQFRQAQKMEAIGQLAGGVAHDFNNILTIIHGHASLLVDNPDLDCSNAESAAEILQAAGRAAGLTRQLLTFSRRQMMQLTLLDLNAVVGNLTSMLGRILGEDIALQLQYECDRAPVEADAGMLEQILLNLVVNSRDAMPRGGVLTIRVGTHTVPPDEAVLRPLARSGEFACLSVTDSGCGIAPEHLQHIFEPFFTTKEVGKGTGLGLATAYGIVKQHQGWIEVDSHIGQGTQFRAYLPIARKAPAPQAQAPQTAIRGGHETIMVVEDESSLRHLVCNLLSAQGYKVLHAGSGRAAVEKWRACGEPIHLLLTDLVMPDSMNGKELAEALWAERPDLKVIFTSGYSAEVVGQDFVLNRGKYFLQKPYHPRQLAKMVRDCLDETGFGPVPLEVRG